MNRKTIKSLVAIAVLTAVLATMYLVPAFAQPGDASDPLVTRSYVTNRISQVTAELNALRATVNSLAAGGTQGSQGGGVTLTDRDVLFADVMIYFEAMYGDMLRAALALSAETDPNPVAPEVVPFEPLFIPAGRTLIAEAGVEFILRSGTATAISGPDGMVDVTDGRDITHGTQIPRNHLLLVPRSDGRGFFTNTDTWVMIKGRFEVAN